MRARPGSLDINDTIEWARVNNPNAADRELAEIVCDFLGLTCINYVLRRIGDASG